MATVNPMTKAQLEQKVIGLEETLSRLKQEKDILQNDLSSANRAKGVAENSSRQLDTKVKNLESQLQSQQDTVTKLRTENQATATELRNVQNTLRQVEKERDALKAGGGGAARPAKGKSSVAEWYESLDSKAIGVGLAIIAVVIAVVAFTLGSGGISLPELEQPTEVQAEADPSTSEVEYDPAQSPHVQQLDKLLEQYSPPAASAN